MKMMVVLGMFFVLSYQPVVMITSLMAIILLYSLMIYMEMGDFWFGYMLILVMLSGVLVVFTYMVSMVPNELFEIGSLMMIMLSIFMLGVYNSKLMLFYDLSIMSLSMWEMLLSFFTLYLVSFLLGLMIMIVWLSSISEGPLRIFW